ncbi:MAG: hypothetical protein QM759_11095 [Terricaulis sp.]
MGHHVTGLITRCGAFGKLEGALGKQPHYALNDGFGFLPLDYKNLDDVVGLHAGNTVEKFEYLTPVLIDLLRAASTVGPLAYVETNYFGGIGGQSAVAFRDGAVVFGPLSAEGDAINQALALLGVSVRPGSFDAFAAVGLDRRRYNEDYRDR